MNILLINKYLYNRGGDAISTLATGQLLQRKGHKANFWGMVHPQNPSYPYEKYFTSYVDFDSNAKIGRKFRSVFNILYSFEAKEKIRELIEKMGKPDIVHLNNFAHQISPSVLLVLKEYNIPTVMTLRDFKLVCPSWYLMKGNNPCEKCKNKKFYHSIINRCHKNSFIKSMVVCLESYIHHQVLRSYDTIQCYIAPSKFLKEKMMEMGFKKNIVYLPNFVNLKEFVPKYEFYENTICYFGRVSHEKGLGTLINAVEGLDVGLKIIGAGPLLESLKLKVEDKKIKNVKFLGYKTGEELMNEIKKSIAVVIPSECYENNPRTILEAFALGKSVIGSRIGGIPELIQDNINGLTFEPGNAADLRLKISSLMNNPAKVVEMGKNARKFAEERFSPEKHYSELIKIYQMAIGREK